jgi:hypothetical protein
MRNGCWLAGEVDALICGMQGSYDSHLAHVQRDIGLAPGAEVMAAMNALVLDKLTLFITDTYVNDQPSGPSWRRSRGWRPTSCASSGWSPRWRCCRIRSSARHRAAVGAARARGARRCWRATARSWR